MNSISTRPQSLSNQDRPRQGRCPCSHQPDLIGNGALKLSGSPGSSTLQASFRLHFSPPSRSITPQRSSTFHEEILLTPHPAVLITQMFLSASMLKTSSTLTSSMNQTLPEPSRCQRVSTSPVVGGDWRAFRPLINYAARSASSGGRLIWIVPGYTCARHAKRSSRKRTRSSVGWGGVKSLPCSTSRNGIHTPLRSILSSVCLQRGACILLYPSH